MVFAVKDSPVYLRAPSISVRRWSRVSLRSRRPFATVAALRGAEARGCLFCAVGAFFRPGYVNAIVQSWLPSLDGIMPKLQAGAKVADIGCGVGFSTLLMAQAFPKSHFIGYDFHAPSIEQANAHAKAHGLADQVRLEPRRPRPSANAISISPPCMIACTAVDLLRSPEHDLHGGAGVQRQLQLRAARAVVGLHDMDRLLGQAHPGQRRLGRARRGRRRGRRCGRRRRPRRRGEWCGQTTRVLDGVLVVTLPSASVTVTVTGYEPTPAKTWSTEAPSAVVPSPKSHTVVTDDQSRGVTS